MIDLPQLDGLPPLSTSGHDDAPPGVPGKQARYGEPLVGASDLVHPELDYECTSACFLVYVAGVYRNLSGAGRLGIHRPFRAESNSDHAQESDSQISDSRIYEITKAYLNKMNVPTKYVELMFSVPSKEMRVITQNEYDDDLRGYVPELKTLLDAKCPSRGLDAKAVITPCRQDVQAKISMQAWRNEFTSK